MCFTETQELGCVSCRGPFTCLQCGNVSMCRQPPVLRRPGPCSCWLLPPLLLLNIFDVLIQNSQIQSQCILLCSLRSGQTARGDQTWLDNRIIEPHLAILNYRAEVQLFWLKLNFNNVNLNMMSSRLWLLLWQLYFNKKITKINTTGNQNRRGTPWYGGNSLVAGQQTFSVIVSNRN